MSDDAKLARLLLCLSAIWAVFVLYGSLLPFDFQARSLDRIDEIMTGGAQRHAYGSLTDRVVNVFLAVPTCTIQIFRRPARLRLDPEKLIAASLPVEGTRFHVLSPGVSARRSYAPVTDVGFSGKEAAFWERLAAQAEELDLTRRLDYAIRYSHIYLYLHTYSRRNPRCIATMAAGMAGASLDGHDRRLSDNRGSLAQRLKFQTLAATSLHPLPLAAHVARICYVPHLVRKVKNCWGHN